MLTGCGLFVLAFGLLIAAALTGPNPWLLAGIAGSAFLGLAALRYGAP